MNLIDKAIGYVSPERAVRRAQARLALEMVRAYDAGKATRRTSGWSATGASANAEVVPSMARVRNRARELVRNNPHASKAIRTLAAQKVGIGITARPDAGAAVAWQEFVENCDYEGQLDLYGLQAMMARTADEAGAVLVRRIRTRDGRIPLRLQVLEPDYLDVTKYGTTPDGNYIIAGIEINKLGQRVAYHLYSQHPGENALLPYGLQSKPVPAAEIIHFYEKERPGQLHGISRLASAMLRMRDHDDWRDAVIVKKKIEACFAAFVTGSGPAAPLGMASAETGTDGTTTGRRIETLSPGMVEYLPTGSQVEFANPSSGVDGGFSKQELHAIAVGCGITYEQLTGDLSAVSYSSIRAGIQDFRAMVDAWRWIYFMPMAMRPIQRWFLEAAWTRGTIRTTNYSFLWTPPAWPYVNPVDDVKAVKEAVRGGLCSLSEAIRGRGDNPADVFNEIHEERETLAELGVIVDTDAGTTSKTTGAIGGISDTATAGEGVDPAESADAADAADAADSSAGTAGTQAMNAIAADVRTLLARDTPAIHVDARSTINVPPAEIRQDINVAPAAAPQVRVEVAPPNVELNAPVTVRAYPKQSVEAIERDEKHDMVRVTRTNED